MVIQKSQQVGEVDSSLPEGDMEDAEDMENAYSTLVDELADTVVNGYESDSFEELMNTLAVAGSYSTQNKFLIRVQDADAVGPFNGYSQWVDEFGRVPEKGSSALYILAPSTVTFCEESEDRAKYCDACDERCEDTYTAVVDYYRVPTFAYSQTVALDEEDKPDDIKDVSVISQSSAKTETTPEQLNTWYDSLITLYEDEGFTVNEVSNPEEWEIQSSARGFFQSNGRNITIRNFRIDNEAEVDIAERLSTLVHELAHSFLQHGDRSLSSAKMEMEAEAVSHIVCQRLDIETEAGVYIASHLRSEVDDLNDKEPVKQLIESSVGRIGDVSSQILNALRTPQNA